MDNSKRNLQQTEQQRMGSLYLLAQDRIAQRLNAGEQLRSESFFKPRERKKTRKLRSEADELLEGTFLAARSAYEERKVQLLANFYANVVFRDDLDSGHANYILSVMESLLITAPDVLRSRLREMSENTLILTLSRLRPDAEDPIRYVLKSLAKRHIHLTAEITDLEVMLTPLVTSTNPGLAATKGLGAITAAQLLVTAGDNPDRLRSEAAFAALCGVSPIPASSGKTTRHRLNRGGDRQANAALHRIVLVRMSYEPRTRDYVARKRAQGHSTKEIIRCLKRAVAREVFTLLTKQVDVPRVDDLRPLRQARGITLTAAAHHFEIWPTILSDVERGLRRHDDLVTAYRQWLTAA